MKAIRLHPPGRTDKKLCRCFGAPVRRVFPDHLITGLLSVPFLLNGPFYLPLINGPPLPCVLGSVPHDFTAGVMAPLVAEEGDELGGEEGEVNVSLEDFTVHGLVGEGEFGKVSAGLRRGLGRGTGPGPGSGLRRRAVPCSARSRWRLGPEPAFRARSKRLLRTHAGSTHPAPLRQSHSGRRLGHRCPFAAALAKTAPSAS